MICASPDLDAFPSFINNELLFSASLALSLGFLFGLDLWHWPLQAAHPSLLLQHTSTFGLPIHIVYLSRVHICMIDSVQTLVLGWNDFFPIFSDFVAHMWPLLPPCPALVLAAGSPQIQAIKPHLHLSHTDSL